MPLPLLQTKLYVPPPRSQLVARPTVTAKLEAGMAHPLTLIAAPAGSGKTTLVSEWIAQTGHPVAWLSLDDDDNDVVRFFSYLIAALRTVNDQLGETALAALGSPQPLPAKTILTLLLNDLGLLAEGFVLVLDDYHLIATQAIHEALTFLIEHLPPSIHLVLTSRIDPPLPLARWRVRAQLAELRAEDLHFQADEAALFLNEVMGLQLTADDIAVLEARTEGWIAALQLAALSMQGRQDLTDFITAFSGSNRFIVDYLAEEVWQRLPHTTQHFLMQTSLLERFCADLSERVTGQPNGQEVLITLEQTNLFLIALDDERRWYRYHHLFRDLLHQRLRAHYDTKTIHELHQRAADWYAGQGLTDEAIQHYLAATATSQAAELIEAVGYQAIGKGHLGRLGVWMEKLPVDLVRAHPRLVLWRAWVLNLTGQPALLEQWLQEAEFNLQTVPPAVAQDMRAQITTLHAYRLRRQGDFALAIAQLQQALADCAPDNFLTRTAVNLNLGFNYWITGQFVLATQALEATQSDARLIHAMHMVLLAQGTQANVAMAQGQLRRARQLCEETIQAGLTHNGGQPFPSTGYAYAILGNILYEQNELAAAEIALQQALELGELMADGTVIRRAIFRLAPLRQMTGARDAAQRLWQRAFAVNDTVEEPQVTLQQVRSWLVQATVAADQDALIRAGQWAATYSQQQSAPHGYIAAFAQLLIAWVELLQGQPTQALTRLVPLIEAAAAASHTQHLIEMLILQVRARAAMGETATAKAQLSQLLRLTAPEGYIRIFVEAGEPMRLLITQWAQSAMDEFQAQGDPAVNGRDLASYLNQLLAAFLHPLSGQSQAAPLIQGETLPPPTVAHRSPAIGNLIEPLSDRECEILSLVADGLSNSEVADKLIVTVGTVKKHLNNIYGKLGVSSRTQAIARGRELQLL